MHLPGRGRFCGDFHGKHALAEAFAELALLSDATFKAEVHDILGNESHVVVLQTVTAQRDGKHFSGRQVAVIHVRHGKIAEVWLNNEDQYEFDEFWS